MVKPKTQAKVWHHIQLHLSQWTTQPSTVVDVHLTKSTASAQHMGANEHEKQLTKKNNLVAPNLVAQNETCNCLCPLPAALQHLTRNSDKLWFTQQSWRHHTSTHTHIAHTKIQKLNLEQTFHVERLRILALHCSAQEQLGETMRSNHPSPPGCHTKSWSHARQRDSESGTHARSHSVIGHSEKTLQLTCLAQRSLPNVVCHRLSVET